MKDKVVVITGGSMGFGKSLAGFLRKLEACVIIASNHKESLEGTSREFGLDFFLADVTSKNDMEKLAEYVVQKYKKIDFWINNAGIQIAPSQVEDVDIEKLHRLFTVNFFGYFYGCQVAVRYMKKQGKGSIVNINSSAGLEGKPNISAYCSSKFAVKGLTESLRKELSGSNIKVYGVYPGGMQTSIYKEKYPDDFNDYMLVDMVAEKVVENLKSSSSELDLIIKRPLK